MNMLDGAKRMVELAQKLGADESEVFIIKSQGKGFTIEKNSISSISGGIERGIGIRVILNKKIGFAYCTHEEKAEESIKQALALSKLGNESEFTFPEPGKLGSIDGIFDDKIINLSVDEALDGTSQLIESALEIDPDIVLTRGGVGYGSEEFVIANSKGLEVEDFGTEISASASCVLRKNGMSSGFEYSSSRILTIDYEMIGRSAAKLAKRGQDAKKIESKEMTVVFTPNALSSLLEFITVTALYGEAVFKGESVYSDKLNEVVAGENISIIDDGTLAGGLNSAVTDDEGSPSKRNGLIEHGVLKGFLFSQSSALEFDQQNTANAMRTERLASSRNYKSPPVVRARNIILEGEKTKLDTLISQVDDGVLVYDVLGAHTSNPVSGDFSVNSSTLFKIQGGEIAYPVKSAMLGGNFHDCLKRISALGDDYKLVSGGLTPISFHIPSASIEGIRVTG
jgi:PmbA protein